MVKVPEILTTCFWGQSIRFNGIADTYGSGDSFNIFYFKMY